MKMLKLFILLTLLTGVIYPLSVTVVGQIIFPEKSSGSLVRIDGEIKGSELLAQKFTGEKFFHPRSSASDYQTIGSSATQGSPTKKEVMDEILDRKAGNPNAGSDAWTSSASGLDPHVSPQNALSQVPRIAAARGTTQEDLNSLVNKFLESPTVGIWGQPRVNVLKLNAYLETQSKHGNTGRNSSEP